MSERDELPIPDTARQDPNSGEILRVWIANKDQQVVLRMGLWKDPAAWGIMLRDLMRHIADAYHQEQGLDHKKTLQRIKAGFDAETSSPTDRPTGRLSK
ncbi:MAG TPA: DUF5076 domain-containing protein [Candidatus Acidoferrales bacterium]|nr:DUF5076 domain-containing protein [Candidatus Acidoferrales bacterium]